MFSLNLKMAFNTSNTSFRDLLLLRFRTCVLFTAIFVCGTSTLTGRNENKEIGPSSSAPNRIQHSQWRQIFSQWLETTEMEGLMKEVENAKEKGVTERQIQAAFCFAESGYHTFEEFGLQSEHIKINLKFSLL